MEMLWPFMYIILHIQIPLCLTLQANQIGVCNRTNSDGSIWFSCCANYQQTAGNTCIDCPNGTFGENCKDHCPNESYGLRCQSKCHCTLDEKCDRVVGCTNSIEKPSNKPSIFSSTIITVVVIVVGLLFGLSFVVWKRKMYIQCSLIDITIFSSLHENWCVFQTCSSVLAAHEDDENHYSEIRESMMVRPMTVYGRQLSTPSASSSSIEDQYHHLSIKSAQSRSNGNNYIIVEKNSTFVDTVDEEVISIQQFNKTKHFKRGETKDNIDQFKPCMNSFVEMQNKRKETKAKLSTSNQSLHTRKEEQSTIVCDYKEESQIYSYARYAVSSECEEVEDQLETLQDESAYTKVPKKKT